MNRTFLFSVLLLFASACAPRPIPTRVVATSTAAVTATATATIMPTALPPATDTPTLVPVATRALTATVTTTATPVPSATPIAYERSSRALLLEADLWGGSPSGPRDAHVPLFRLYGDGFVVFAGDRAPLSSGLDAVVRTGRLSDSEITSLLMYIARAGFFDLKDSYEPRPKPADMPTATISIYLNKVKTVSVYSPGYEGGPQVFNDVFSRITRSVPADAQTYTPTDGYLESTDAGPASGIPTKDVADWTITTQRLVDAVDGVTVAGNVYSQTVTLRAINPNSAFFREGERAYRVRFEPSLPRAVHLTDVIGMIASAPREFDGRVFEIVGYYRGWNLLGEASGSPVNRSDWVIADSSGAMYVTGAAPARLDPSSRTDAWNLVRLTAKAVYVRNGTSYLEARQVTNLSPIIAATPVPTPTPISITTADAAIAMVKATFPEVAKIQKQSPGILGGTTDIKTFDRGDGWELAFIEGWGDCAAGCINYRYYYYSVRKDGRTTKVGEYVNVYNSATNMSETTGKPMWGVPK